MDKRLKHMPAYYLEKLSLYAADTVDAKSVRGLSRQKVNKRDYPIVVEAAKNGFKIYLSRNSSTYLFSTDTNSIYSTKDFVAFVQLLPEQVELDVHVNTRSKIAFSLWVILGLIIGLLSPQLPILLFLGIVFIAGGVWLMRSRDRFKTLVINFMNGL